MVTRLLRMLIPQDLNDNKTTKSFTINGVVNRKVLKINSTMKIPGI
jgi:hypothetical protein